MAKVIYEFAIKKSVLNSGKTVLKPVCRRKQNRISALLNKHSWDRIVKVYDVFILMELDFDPELSHEECEKHIEGYKLQLRGEIQDVVASNELHELEEVAI